MKTNRGIWRRVMFALTFLCATNTLMAQRKVELSIWPDGAPNTNGLEANEDEKKTDFPSKIVTPTLTVHVANKPNGKAILCCPGGGYSIVAMNHEGNDMAAWLNAQGYTLAVLKYRMPNGNDEVPLSDALQAMRILRQHSEEWKISKIGIMGASAGGHLASTAATHYTEDSRPDFQVLFYPVISMQSDITHRGSRENLIGKNPSEELVNKYSNELHVNAQTPPAFILHSSDDGGVVVENSIRYYQALVKNRVPVSFHCYPVGGHGWGYRDSFPYKHLWKEELEKWLREL
ncbi:MAG: alpha/beta hydrolase [Bacteroidaceae bacterium]|nr:alpha/beta hydrolase [Bacteroidaceae bacterium]